MSFVTFHFLIIAGITVLVYYLTPIKYRWYVLLVASVYFYYTSAGLVPPLVALITVLIVYAAGRWIENATDVQALRRNKLVIAVVFVLGALVVFKCKRYVPYDTSWLIVPLGVSYYTFSLIGYLADVYYKKQQAERSLFKLVLYTLYFLKIVQGPISKFKDIGPRLVDGHRFDYSLFCFGIQRMLWGYFKKLVIADRAVIMTSSVFDDFTTYDNGGAILIIVTVLATIRFYCDFSGYMDIAIGLSQMMGIELDENFRQPFFSKSAAEFWRRWHITLGVWFKDYVYMPLVSSSMVVKASTKVRGRFGKRAGKAMFTVIPLAVVWILTGLWHGTGLNYIFWGIYWGTIIILSNVYSAELKKINKSLHINADSTAWKWFQMVRTFCIFMGGLLMSTFVGYKHLGLYFKTIFTDFNLGQLFDGTVNRMGLSKSDIIILIISVLLLWIVEIMQTKGSVRERVAKWIAPIRWFIYATMFVIVIFLGIYGAGYNATGFVYAFY